MRFQLAGSKVDYAVKHCHLLYKIDFSILDKQSRLNFYEGVPGCLFFCFLENTAGTGVGILDIGSALLFEVKSFLPVENRGLLR